ncbi:MAG: DUF445 domain-containing protein [Firmicutes bacterium]|nr:DUF445 domain-containing protein [Bacillota bacterium]
MQRRWANLSLGIALAMFLLALAFRHNPVAPYVLAAALASLAGGVADWFAVTALFRHPLGLTWVPHTSIIAKNRQRIIEAIVVLVQNELLSFDFIQKTLNRFNVVDRLIAWLKPGEAASDGMIERLVPELIELLPLEDMGAMLSNFVTRQAEAWSASDLLANLIKWLIQSEKDHEVFVFLSHEVKVVLSTVEFTEDMEQRLKAMIDQYSKTTTQKLLLGVLESLGTIDYKDLSETVRGHLIAWIDSDKAFEQFELALVRFRIALRDDEKIRTTVEQIKAEMVRQVPWQDLLERVVDQLQRSAVDGSLGREIGQWRLSLASRLENDPSARERLDSLIKEMAEGLIRRYHPIIGRLVRDNLQSMDEREWIDKLEWYVGGDLQWIRINGAIVGGIVGLVMETVLRIFRVGL